MSESPVIAGHLMWLKMTESAACSGSWQRYGTLDDANSLIYLSCVQKKTRDSRRADSHTGCFVQYRQFSNVVVELRGGIPAFLSPE